MRISSLPATAVTWQRAGTAVPQAADRSRLVVYHATAVAGLVHYATAVAGLVHYATAVAGLVYYATALAVSITYNIIRPRRAPRVTASVRLEASSLARMEPT